jgi:zinc transport system ATP-binding protein
MVLLEMKDVSLGYDNKIIIKDINIQIENTDYICIVGNNGSGKTTLIKGLLGLIPNANKKGEVKLSPTLSQRQIGYLPQITIAKQNFPASVYEVVASGILNTKKISPFLTTKEKKQIDVALNKLCIMNIKQHNFSKLSGGQQQKVLLARSLCAAQKVLILDEPISSLDETSRLEVYQLIEQLHQEEHMVIIMITHNLDEVLPYATRILEVKDQHVTTKTYIKGETYDR